MACRNGNDLSSADQLATVLLQLRAFGGIPSADVSTPWQLQLNVDQITGAGRQELVNHISVWFTGCAMQRKLIQIDTAPGRIRTADLGSGAARKARS